MPAKSFLSLLPRAGDVHLGSYVLPGWRPSKVMSLPWIWNCMKPENWLRISFSGDWCHCTLVVMHATIGLDWQQHRPLNEFCSHMMIRQCIECIVESSCDCKTHWVGGAAANLYTPRPMPIAEQQRWKPSFVCHLALKTHYFQQLAYDA